MNDDMVTITKATFVRLLTRDAEMNRLERGGVDNWMWFGECWEDWDDEKQGIIDTVEKL